MKNPYEVLKQKEADMGRIQKEIEALHLVIPLLAEDADWVEHGLAPPLSTLQVRGTGTAGMQEYPRRGRVAEALFTQPHSDSELFILNHHNCHNPAQGHASFSSLWIAA